MGCHVGGLAVNDFRNLICFWKMIGKKGQEWAGVKVYLDIEKEGL